MIRIIHLTCGCHIAVQDGSDLGNVQMCCDKHKVSGEGAFKQYLEIITEDGVLTEDEIDSIEFTEDEKHYIEESAKTGLSGDYEDDIEYMNREAMLTMKLTRMKIATRQHAVDVAKHKLELAEKDANYQSEIAAKNTSIKELNDIIKECDKRIAELEVLIE